MDNLSSPTTYVGPLPWWQAPFPAVVLCEKSKLGTFQNSKQAFNALERAQHEIIILHVTRAHKEKWPFGQDDGWLKQ